MSISLEHVKETIDKIKIQIGIETKLLDKKTKAAKKLGINSPINAKQYIDKQKKKIKELKNNLEKLEKQCQNLLDEIED